MSPHHRLLTIRMPGAGAYYLAGKHPVNQARRALLLQSRRHHNHHRSSGAKRRSQQGPDPFGVRRIDEHTPRPSPTSRGGILPQACGGMIISVVRRYARIPAAGRGCAGSVGRRRPRQDVGQRGHIVVGGPAAYRQKGCAEDRQVTAQRGDRLELVGRVVAAIHHVPVNRASSQRDAHLGTQADPPRQVGGNRVPESLVHIEGSHRRDHPDGESHRESASALRRSTKSVFSQANPASSRPKCP